MQETIYLMGVVARRDLLTGLRSWQGQALLVTTTLALSVGAAAAIVYVTSDYTTAVDVLSFYYRTQSWLLFAVALVAVPGLAAVSVTAERSAEGYDVILTTPMPPSALVLGKYVAIIVYFFLFCATVLPFTGVLYFFAWVEIRHLVKTAWWVVPMACCTAAIGVAAAVLESSPMKACVRAYPYLMVLMLLQEIREGVQVVVGFVISPEIFNTTCLSIVTVGALGQAVFALARFAESPNVQAGRSLPRTPLEGFRVLFPPGTTDFPDRTNPFGRRCLCGSGFQNNGVLFVLALLAFFFHVCLVAPALSDPVYASLPWVIERSVFMLVPAIVALQLVKELEAQTMDTYRLTLLSPLELVAGQYIGIARRLVPFLLPVLVVRLMFALYMSRVGSGEYMYWQELILIPLRLAVVVALALAGASFARTAFAAIPLSFGVVLALGVPFLVLTMDTTRAGALSIEPALITLTASLLAGIVMIGAATAITWFRVRIIWNRRA